MDDFTDRISIALAKARVNADLSQRKLAERMNSNRTTITKWELGYSEPPLSGIIRWLTACGVSATRYMDACIHPGLLEHLEDDLPDAEKRRILHEVVDEIGSYEVDALLYIRYGDHGSDHIGVLTEVLANLHSPLYARVSHCGTIISDYEMAQARGVDPDPNGLQPKMPVLYQAHSCGWEAAMADKGAYTIAKEVILDAQEEKR